MNLFLLTLFLALPILLVGMLFLSIKIKAKNLRFLLAFSAAYLFAISMVSAMGGLLFGYDWGSNRWG